MQLNFNNFLILALALTGADATIQTKCQQRGMFAMTWDDGPAQYTPQLLQTLRSKGVKATFHITTKYLTDPNIQAMIQNIASDGHLIGLRTETDWDLMSMSKEQIQAGLARQANVLASFIGYTPKFVRLPYNKYDDRVLRAVEETGLVVSSFNLESYDYTGDSKKILDSIKLSLSLTGSGAGSFISIQHDGVQGSVGVTDKIIDEVKRKGYKFVKLDECLGMGDMRQNKEPLKGADDSLDLGPMGGDLSAGGMVSGPGGEMAVGGDSPLAGQGSKSKSSASMVVPSTAAALIAAALALLL